jgi:hypothetical protein
VSFHQVFDLMGELARAHSKDLDQGNTKIHVVPVVVNDLSQVVPALEALCAIGDGVLMNAIDDDQLQHPVPAASDPIRRAAVEAELATTRIGGSIDIKYFDVGADRLDARIDGRSTSSALSTSELMTLAVARAIMHAKLDQHKLAVIVYSDSPLDLFLRSALWRLGASHLASLDSAFLRTLVLAVESRIDITRHCQGEGGLRFALEDGRLLRRNGPDALGSDTKQIASHSAPVVLFLGAGFSASSHLPIGNSLRDQAIARLLNITETIDPDSEELCRRFHDFALEKSNLLLESEKGMNATQYQEDLTLEQVVFAESLYGQQYSTLAKFKESHDQRIGTPGSAVIDLARAIAANPQHFVIVEVNFDLLIETHLSVPFRVFATDSEFKKAPDYIARFLAGEETEVPILKLHGTISDFSSCIVRVDQTETGLGVAKRTALEALLSDPQRLWVYVGASMRDKDLIPFFQSEKSADGLDERWVSPFLVETIDRFASCRERKWSDTDRPALQDRVITETADCFFKKLADIMTS